MTAVTFLDKARAYLPPDRMAFVERALDFATEAHEGQRRKSGAPFIEHPIATAEYLAALHIDANTLAAALLHDTMEDCGVQYKELERRFNADVAMLVDAVTKLNKIDLIPRSETGGPSTDQNGSKPALETRSILGPGSSEHAVSPERAASMRKMFVAMAKDVRVVLIKLADRLHNMMTLQALRPDRQVAIAQETLDIYAPLADRLGIWDIKWRLEDESFKYLYPRDYRAISRLLARKRAEREAYVARATQALEEAMKAVDIEAEVSGRAKHIYSIYEKSKRYESQGRKLEDIHDLIALRLIVDDVGDCYAALGVVHGMWHPVRGQFDDYIANPKDNMYQSLHTLVRCLDGYPVEVQIRTHEMHEIAEYGVAAHTAYKEGGSPRDRFEERMTLMRQLLEAQRDAHGDQEYLESIKTDILRDQVFVYTPAGDVVELPANATALDFAYRIHTEVGHSCVGALVNGKLTALNTPLESGDTVLIRKAKKPYGPRLDWLNPDLGFLVTHSAREKVAQWFRRQDRAEKRERGHTYLRKQIRRLHLQLGDAELARFIGFASADDLYEAIGSGQLDTGRLIERIMAAAPEEPAKIPAKPVKPGSSTGIVVLGMPGLLTRIARCCGPVYGDDIIGYLTRGKGVTIHRSSCPNIRNEDEPERLVEVAWGHSDSRYPVRIRIDAWDRVGLIRDITSVVSSEKVNIHSLTSRETDSDDRCTVTLTVYTTGSEQLSRLFSRLETVQGVQGVLRDSLTEQVDVGSDAAVGAATR